MVSALTERTWYVEPAARRWRCDAPGDAARAFHATLPGYGTTPLVDVPDLAAELDVGLVLVKDESSRLGLPAFKILGASWAVARLLADRGGLTGTPTLDALRQVAADTTLRLVTATDGNHGRAVGRMAALVGLEAHVVVPAPTSPHTEAAIASEGAVVERIDGDYDEAVRHAAALADERADDLLVQDTAWPGYERVPAWIVDGYATLALEIDEQLSERGVSVPDLVVVPVGVGSLAQALLAHYRRRDRARAPSVLSVEPDTAACVLASLRAGERTTVPTGTTVMAGLNCGTPSSTAWPLFHAGLDAAVAVTDREAARAVEDLAAVGISAGPSGAASLAGARAVLTGPGAAERRALLDVDERAVVVLLSTEGAPEDPRP